MERNGHVGFQFMALVDPQRIITGVCFAFCTIIIILLIAQQQYSHTPNGMFGSNVYPKRTTAYKLLLDWTYIYNGRSSTHHHVFTQKNKICTLWLEFWLHGSPNILRVCWYHGWYVRTTVTHRNFINIMVGHDFDIFTVIPNI